MQAVLGPSEQHSLDMPSQENPSLDDRDKEVAELQPA
jgi:hypothetical protein